MSFTDEPEGQEKQTELKHSASSHSGVPDTGAKEVLSLASGHSLTKEPPSEGVDSPTEHDFEDQRGERKVRHDPGSRMPGTARAKSNFELGAQYMGETDSEGHENLSKIRSYP